LKISEQEKSILKLFAKKIDPNDPGAHNNLACVYFNKGLIKESIEELKKALEIDPSFTTAKNNIEYIYKTTGYYDENINRLKDKIRKNPRDLKARLELAKSYKSTGDYYKAITHYNKYLRINPKDLNALLAMGISCKAIGFYEVAIENFKKALRINDEFAPAHKYLGEVYYNLGLFSQAINELKKSIKIDSKDAEAYFLLSFAYGEEGRFDDARKSSDKAIKLNPRYAKIEPNLGLGIYRQKGYQDFIDVKDVGVKDKPFFSHYAMGLTYKNRGMFDEAIRELRRAEEADPENTLVKEQLGEVLLFMGKNGKAISEYLEAIKEDPDSPKLANNIGIACHRLGRLNEAMSWYKKAIENDKNYAVSWNNLGVVNYHSGNSEDALKCFKTAHEMNPDYLDPYLNLGIIYTNKGYYSRAEKLFKKAIQKKDEYSLPYNYLGSVYLNNNQYNEAIHCFKQAITKDNNFAEAYYNLGFAFSRIGKYDKALEATKKAMEINPFYSNNLFKLGLDIYSEQLDILVSRELTEEMGVGGELGEEVEEEEIFENLFIIQEEKIVDLKKEIEKAESFYEEEKFDNALELLSKLRGEAPNNEEILILLGKVYKSKGLLGEAKDVLMDLVPENEEANKVLASVYLENKEFKRANEIAKIIREHDKIDSFSYFVSAKYFEHQNKFEKAVQTLKSCPKWRDESRILQEIASLNFTAGNLDEALSFILRSISISPSSTSYLILSRIEIKQKKYESAQVNLLKAIKMDPNNKQALRLLVRTRLELEDYDGTIEAAKNAQEVIKADGKISFWLGKAYYKKGIIDKAIECVRQSISFDDKNIQAYRTLASLYFQAGMFKKAEKLWETIMERCEDEEIRRQAKDALLSLLRLRKITGEI
jgi:tetratricopeptide (TPR) repeat protein